MNITILVTELKEVKKNIVVYYYEVNDYEINKETAGLVEFDIKLFEKTKDSEDLSKVISEKIISNEIKILKSCSENYTLDDGVDVVGIIAVRDILSKYQLKNEIPKQTFYLSSEIVIELLNNKNTSEILMKYLHY